MTTPLEHDPYAHPRGRFMKGSFLPIALITLGVVFLLGNMVPEPGRGGLVLLGLGIAFLLGRLTTGRYGYAVPAGILVAIGAFASLPALQPLFGQRISSGGTFFVLLGLGFVLVYLVGMRPAAVWPLFPATVLVLLGLVLLGVGSAAPLAGLSWTIGFWPLVLVLLGIWLLFREHLPPSVRPAVATLGALALLVYGVVAAVAGIASGGALARSGFGPTFGAAPFTDTITLDQPISDGQILTIANTSGRTTVRAASASANTVHVTATRHFSVAGQAPPVALGVSGSNLALQASDQARRGPFGAASWVDYDVEVPAGSALKVQTTSGDIDIGDVNGPVEADATSGAVTLSNLAGPVRATSTSGRIRATDVRHLQQASSSSGSIGIEGIFTEPAQISANSGSVDLKLLPSSAVQLDVRTSSGSISAEGLVLGNESQQRNALSGTLGAPAAGAALSVQTSSGSVHLSQ